MIFGVKGNRVGGILAGCFLMVLLASVGQATEVTITAADQGNGGVAITVHGSTETECCDNRTGDCTTFVTVTSPTVCMDFGEGSASCTGIRDRGALHGTHVFEAYATDCKKNTVSTTTTTNFDNTPSVSVTGPSGTVLGAFDITGTATFTPTLNATKGTVYVYINNSGTATKACSTETCTFSFQELYGRLYDMPHGGPYSIKFTAIANSNNVPSAEATGSFSVDKTPTVSVTGPSGTVSAPFDVTGTATFKKGITPDAARGTISAFVSNGVIGSKICTTETCEFSYQALSGQLYDYASHGGPYPIKFIASAYTGPTAEATGSFSVDKMPTVSVTGPSGTVSAPFDVTGTATFKPTLQPIKGTIYAMVNGGCLQGKNCPTETCTYSYKELTGSLYDMSHGGPYPIKFTATGGGATATDTGSFSVDKTPTVTITTPPGGRVKTPFDIAGTATFKPTTDTTKGSIAAYINNGYIGGKTCTTESCTFSYQELSGRPSPASVGNYVLKLTATGGGASASDEREINVEDLPDNPGCPDPPPGTCPLCQQ